MILNWNKKLLISSSAKKTIRESAKLAQSLDLGMEISRIPLYKSEGMTVQDTVDYLKEELEGFQNRLTLHAMFSDVNISSADYELKAISQKRFIQSYEVGKLIGADTVLFHTGYKGTKHTGSIFQFKKKFTEFWMDFIIEFEKSGMTAVIENVFEQNPDFCMDLYDRIASDNFKLALDTGHVNLYAKGTQVTDWINKYAEKLHHMHIHNNFGENDDHSNLLNGTLDFRTIFENINDNGLEPSMVLEMYSEEDILKSVEYLKYFKDM